MAQPCTPSWTALGDGMGSIVYALAVFDDGTGPALYAGGLFTTAGGVPANRIAKWNGSAWSGVGGGMNNNVYSLAVFDDGGGPALYAGGLFTIAGGVPASRIAKWNGQTWSALGAGVNNYVWAMTGFDDGEGEALFVGGVFTTAGGQPANYIARWDGQTWLPLGMGTSNPVYAARVFDDGSGPALYIGGGFTSAGGQPNTAYVARWDGVAFSPLELGLGGYVKTLAVFDDGKGQALYAGGNFMSLGTGAFANRIARWDGQAWAAAGQFNEVNPVHSLAVFDDRTGSGPALYAATGFAFPANILGNTVTRLTAGLWTPVGGGTGDYVEALAVYDDGGGEALYAGGLFTTAGGRSARHIARWGCPPQVCYANCDNSTAQPILNVNDFVCFQQRFAAGDPYANCDGSTAQPNLNINDFVCFQQQFAAGCP
jgi:hypothetical protein